VSVAGRRLGAGVAAIVLFGVAAGAAIWRTTEDRGLGAQPVASVAGVQLERDATVDAELSQRLRASVVRVEATGCGVRRQATATVFDSTSGPRAVTNQHVVEGTTTVDSWDPSGAEVTLGVRRRVSGRDAALLDADALLGAGVEPLAVGPRPIVGSGVVVAGFPGGGFEARAGHVTAVERRQGFGGTVDMLIVDVEAIPGISGGVVVDGQGRAVGVVAARDPETGSTVAYPLDTIRGATRAADTTC
jgi:putative serine protease PepD